MSLAPVSERTYDPIDLSSKAFWSRHAAERERSFATLREQRPVSWHPPAEQTILVDEDDPGFWAVTRHADIVTVSRTNEVFLSGKGVMFEDAPQELLETTQSFLAMDPPRHTKLRRLASAALTPRQVRRTEESIKTSAQDIVAELRAAGPGADFVEHCAKELPMRTLADLVGIPASEREAAATAADAMVSAGDPVFLAGRDPLQVMMESIGYLHQLVGSLAAHRREHPANDLITNLVNAEVDGDRLTDAEIAAYFVLLCVAGNDTTRQTTSHAMKALTDHPDQRAWLMADFDNRITTAVEEFIRYASPVMTFRRTAATDYELGGQTIRAGEKVVMFYASGNRDSTVFDRPECFDLSRHPNPHLGFGGGGEHYCPGTHVARAQLRAIFDELLHGLPGITAGEPEYLAGNFIHGVRAMPCTW